MKNSKTKFLIILAIAVMFVCGISYLLLTDISAQQSRTKAEIPSTAVTGTQKVVATSPNVPEKPPAPPPPEHQLPSLVLTAPEVNWEASKTVRYHRKYNFTPTPSSKALLTEDFEEGIMPPTDWSVVVTNPYTWEIDDYNPYEGLYNASCFYDPDLVPQDEWLISPVINLTSKGEEWHLYFFWMASYYWAVDPYDNYDLEVWIDTDGDDTFDNMLWCEDAVGVFSSWTWYMADVDLADYLIYPNAKLGWRYVGSDGAQASLDFINVDTPPIGRCCYGPDPYNPLCADVTEDSCNTLGGTWDYGLNCTDNPCPIPGVGDNCDTPIEVTIPGDLPYSDLSQTTCGKIDDYDNTCLGYYDGGEDIIYELTVTTDTRVDIVLDPKGTDYTGICIDDVCPPDDACIGVSTNSGSDPHGIMNVDLPAGTYYIMIDTWPSPDCIDDFDLTITEVTAPPPPNDDCEDAIMLYPPVCPDEQIVDGTTIAAGIDCPGFLDWPAVWYTFVLSSENNCSHVFIDFCAMTIDLSSVGAVMYDECPPVCDDPIYMTEGAFVDCPNGTYNAQIWYKNLPDGQYWLPIYVKDLSDNEYLDFSFGICAEECPPAQPGDNCDNPIVVNLNKGPGDTLYLDQNQTNCGRGNNYSSTCLGSYDGGEDIIYQVNVSTAVDVDILMDPKGTSWTGMAIDNACPPGDPCMNYDTGSSGSRFLGGVHLEPGTYYIMVDTWPSPDCIPDFDLVITEAGAGLENDDCADATAIGDVTNLPFNTSQATFDGGGTCLYSPNIWYLYTATCDGNVTVSLCGSDYDTKLAVYDGSSCDPLSPEIDCNDDYCGLQSEITFTGAVMGNQYLIEVGGYSSNTGAGVLTVSCYEPGEPPENDECTGAPIINTFPTTVFGTTIDATIDCPGVLDWDAVWYQFDVPYESNDIYVDFCPTDDDIATVGIVLYDECPPDCPGYMPASGYQFVDCPNGTYNPQMWWYDLPGPASYWFPVYVEPAKGAMDFGFTVDVEEAVPCVVECPPGGYDEGEGYCYDDYDDTYNGGCNASPFVFQEIACGDTICGSCGVYDFFGSTYRDMDWFEIQVSEGDLTLTCVAEFPLALWLFDPVSFDCVDMVNLDFINTTGVCDTLSVSAYVASGTYWLIIAPMDWGSYPCGDQSEYVAWLDCQPFGPQISVSPASFYQELNPDSTAEQDLFITNVGGEDLDYDITHEANTWLGLRPTSSGTLLPGETDNLVVMFDAYGLGVGDYYDLLKIASNSAGKQLEDTVEVPVHLMVEYPPDIDVAPTVSMGVIPGCTMDKPLRIDNLGEGELRFEISVTQNPPPLMAGESNIRGALEALRKAGKANPTIVPKEAYKVIGAERLAVEYISTGTSEGLLLLAGKGETTADILLVDDDGGLPGGTYYDIEDIYMAALDAGGYVYDYYNVDWSDPLSDGPDLSTLQAYNCVVWFCGETWGYYGLDVLTPNDEANLGAYLAGGGNLFLSAQDWLWASYPSAGSFSPGQFPYDYLHLASANQDMINDPYTCTGLAGSVAEGMSFQTLRFTDSPDVPLWTDYLTTQSSAAVDVFDAQGGVSAIQYNPAKGYKVVFTTTAFPGLVDSSPSTRAELMASIIDWFECSAPVCPFTVAPEEGTIPPGESAELILTFDGDAFPQCEDGVPPETVTCYLKISSNDPIDPEVSVEVNMWSGRGDVMDPECLINIGDVVFLVNFVLKGGPAPDPLCMGDCDPTYDAAVDMADIIYLIQYLWQGGMPPLAVPTSTPTPIERK